MKILGDFWSTSLAAEMEYRANFALAAVVSLGNVVGSVFLIFLLCRGGYQPGGWSFEEAMLVVGYFTVMESFANGLLRANLSRIVRHVQDGTLDFILLKPVDSQFWLSTRNFSAWGVPSLVYAFLLLAWAGAGLGLTWGNWAAGLTALALGCVVLYSLWFILGATSIWFVKVHNVTHVLYSLLAAGRFPLSAYPVAYQFLFTFVIPIAFLTTVPATVSLGRGAPGWLAAAALIAVVSFLASRAFWGFALRRYTSASS